MSESTLLQNLRAHFNESELRDLCFELYIEYENVVGQAKSDKARELILYCERHGRLLDLKNACRRLRSHIDWEAPPSEESPTIASRQTPPVGLGALIELMQTPGVRTAAGGFQMVFRTSCDQIKALTYYKRLHDFFQELEIAYDPLEADYRMLVANLVSWDQLLTNAPALNDAIVGLLGVVDESPITHERPPWAQQLDQLREALSRIIDHVDSGMPSELELAEASVKVDPILKRLNRVLDREPSNINNLLVDRANALHLSELVDAMTLVRNSMSSLNQDVVAIQQFDAGLNELIRQRDSLAEQVRSHNLWQAMDDELRRVKNNLGSDLLELELTWPDLSLRAHALCADTSATWAAGIVQAGTQLQGALTMAVKAPDRIRRYFYNYRRKATQRFRQVDDDLLRLCDDLQGTGEKLDVILQALQ